MPQQANENVVTNTTCFAEHEKRGLTCEKKSCRLWMTAGEHLNCAAIAASNNDEGMTLQQIGDILGVTRMRICQIEKKVVEKLSSMIN